MKKACFAVVAAFVILFSSPAMGAPILSIGDYFATPGDTLQIEIYISDITTEQITDFSFDMEIVPDDGNLLPGDPLNSAPGSAVPSAYHGNFGAVDINNKVMFMYNGPLLNPPSLTNGLIASLDLSLSGLGSWDLGLSNLAFGDADGNPYSIGTDDGTVSGIPIPGSMWLFGSFLIGLLGIRTRFRKC